MNDAPRVHASDVFLCLKVYLTAVMFVHCMLASYQIYIKYI